MASSYFYEEVSRLCTLNGISITALAREVGLSSTAPTDWKKGSRPRAGTLKAVADYFEVSIDTLTEGQGCEQPAIKSNIIKGDNNSNIKQTINDKQSLSAHAEEMLRIFSELDIVNQAKALSYTADLAKENEKPPATVDGN